MAKFRNPVFTANDLRMRKISERTLKLHQDYKKIVLRDSSRHISSNEIMRAMENHLAARLGKTPARSYIKHNTPIRLTRKQVKEVIENRMKFMLAHNPKFRGLHQRILKKIEVMAAEIAAEECIDIFGIEKNKTAITDALMNVDEARLIKLLGPLQIAVSTEFANAYDEITKLIGKEMDLMQNALGKHAKEH